MITLGYTHTSGEFAVASIPFSCMCSVFSIWSHLLLFASFFSILFFSPTLPDWKESEICRMEVTNWHSYHLQDPETVVKILKVLNSAQNLCVLTRAYDGGIRIIKTWVKAGRFLVCLRGVLLVRELTRTIPSCSGSGFCAKALSSALWNGPLLLHHWLVL